jgi:hypothetical protein
MVTPTVRSVVRAIAVGAVIVALVATGRADAAPFAGERFAPVVDMSGETALDVQSLTVAPGDNGSVRFGLVFSGPFAPPNDGYRVSVSLGDPTARRTRWTLAVVGGQVVGVVESGDGTVWTQTATTTASLDSDAGTASIDAVPGSPPEGSVLWVDAQLPTPLGSIGASSTYFSYDVLTGPQVDPSVAGTVWGAVRDQAGSPSGVAVRIPGAAPVASIVNRALVIASAGAPPGLLLGQPVTSGVDAVHFLAATSATPGDGGVVLVDRVTGDVQLLTVREGVSAPVEGAAERLLPAGAAASGPPGTRTVSLVLAAVERELGLPDDPSDVAMSVDRSLTLTDGSVVTASGVAATVASLEAVGTTSGVDPAPSEVVEPVSGSSNDGLPLALVAAVVLVALVGVGVVVAVALARRRRRRHESLVAEGWFDRDLAAGPVRPPGSAADVRAIPEFAAAAVARPEPPVPEDAVQPASDEVVLDLDAPIEAATSNGHDSPAAVDAGTARPVTEPDDGARDHATPDDQARATQDRALEELEAQFADLFERVDRLGSSRDGD